MSSQVWTFAGVAVVALLTFLGTRYSSRSSEQVAKTTVEADAYTKALKIWTEGVERLEADVARLERSLSEARSDIRALTEDRAASESREAASESRGRHLEERVRVLEQTLIEQGIEVPPWHPTATL